MRLPVAPCKKKIINSSHLLSLFTSGAIGERVGFGRPGDDCEVTVNRRVTGLGPLHTRRYATRATRVNDVTLRDATLPFIVYTAYANVAGNA